MKCIILAGGMGTRLGPCTLALSKQILPVYDKPMIYYPLSLALLSGIKEILVISSAQHLAFYQVLLGTGAQWGIKISYVQQTAPNGIAEAFLLGEDFIEKDPVALILGDNIFYGHGLTGILKKTIEDMKKAGEGAKVFGYAVPRPHEYGVADFDEQGEIFCIEEKPSNPPSPYAVPGLYFYDNTVVQRAKQLEPSARGELEITTLNNAYAKDKKLSIEIFGRGIAWFDTGNPDSLLDAANFVCSIERSQGIKMACIEEICYRNGWMSAQMLDEACKKFEKSQYGSYLYSILHADQKR
ncbi:MAG: glucose-1-phosphate thymidylyltransferase RfbA [Spirochaetia bacterium]